MISFFMRHLTAFIAFLLFSSVAFGAEIRPTDSATPLFRSHGSR
jgi:hypothetical protein